MSRTSLVRNAKGCKKLQRTRDVQFTNGALSSVSEKDVTKNRTDRINSKPIPETRKLHAVKPCNMDTTGVAM